MSVPNCITRTLDLPYDQSRVWAALTTVPGLTQWFGREAEGEVVPGGEVVMRFPEFDYQTTLAIKVVEPMTTFAYCWPIPGAPDGDPRRTYVEFVLEPVAAGTRLTVTESGFAQVPDAWIADSYQGNVNGWAEELAELAGYLDAA